MNIDILPAPAHVHAMEKAADASIRWILGRFARFVRFQAGKMTNDPELYEELVQEGAIALWEVQHWRLDLEDQSDRVYLRRMVRRRMWRARAALTRQGLLPKGPPELGAHGLGWHPVSTVVGLDHIVQRTPLPD